MPQMHCLGIKCRVLVCCTCHFQSGSSSFVYFGFLCSQVSSVSNFCSVRRGEGGHLFRLTCSDVLWEGGILQQKLLARVGSAHNGWTTLGLPQPETVCTSRVHTTQAPGCSARALSQVGPAFCALSMSPLLRFLGAPQGHRPRWAVCFVPFPSPSSSGDRVLGELTVSGGPGI